MSLFSKAKVETVEQVVPFEVFQDQDGIINAYFSMKFEGYALGKKYRFNVGFWHSLNIHDERADCTPYLEELKKLEDKTVPITMKMKNGKLDFMGMRINTDYLAEKTGDENFKKLEYDYDFTEV